jgi:hypothetical protein
MKATQQSIEESQEEALEILLNRPDEIKPEKIKGDSKEFYGLCSARNLALDSWHSLAVYKHMIIHIGGVQK